MEAGGHRPQRLGHAGMLMERRAEGGSQGHGRRWIIGGRAKEAGRGVGQSRLGQVVGQSTQGGRSYRESDLGEWQRGGRGGDRVHDTPWSWRGWPGVRDNCKASRWDDGMRDGHTGEGAPDAACGEQGATPGVFTLQVTSHLHFREDTCRRKQPWKVWRSGEVCSAESARWQVVVKALDSGRLPVRVCLSRGGRGGDRPEPRGALLWEAEGKQSSDPASKEAPGDTERPRKRTISESPSLPGGQRVQAGPSH